MRQRRNRPFKTRSESELRGVVKEWMAYVHPRAHEYFQAPAMLEELLTTIATHIDKNDDPVQGGIGRCVPWHGDRLHGDAYVLAKDVLDKAATENREGGDPGTENLVANTIPRQELPAGSGEDIRRQSQAVMQMVKPAEHEESMTYINRILTFIFAADESFDSLMRVPMKEPFTMTCGNQLCINLLHVSSDP